MFIAENSCYNFLVSRHKIQKFAKKAIDKPYSRDEICEDLMLSGVRHVGELAVEKAIAQR